MGESAATPVAERFPWALAAPGERHWPDREFLDVALSATRNVKGTSSAWRRSWWSTAVVRRRCCARTGRAGIRRRTAGAR